MPLAIHLLGKPHVEGATDGDYQVRSRKSWALLAYLLLRQGPPPRTELASLLFTEADDPLRALRWNLSEIRRALSDGARIDGDPVVLELPPDATVDVHVVTSGSWTAAVQLPGLGAQLLDGAAPKEPAFGMWLLSQQRRVAEAAEAVLHEAALGSLSQGRLNEAISYAVRAMAMSPLDENHHALLIRLYRLSGDLDAAQRQHASCVELFLDELGTAPGPAVSAAIREIPRTAKPVHDLASLDAVVEAGTAAIAAGAVQAGLESLRAAVRLTDESAVNVQQVKARLVLAEALIHAEGGLDEEGLASLHEADALAAHMGDQASMAQARAELGYVDFLRARYDRAEQWLTQALDLADGSLWTTAKAMTYLGAVHSDRGAYPRARDLLEHAIALSREAKDPRREAFATSMLGRVHLLRRDLQAADERLAAAIDLAAADHWLAFLPWPQGLRGEVQLLAGDTAAAAVTLQQAFARACQLGDPCWEGLAARGRALVAVGHGNAEEGIVGLLDARERCNRLADPYVWLEAYILDALCGLGLEHDHPDAPAWINTMAELTSRAGMRELELRSLRHSAALGVPGAADAASLLAAGLDPGAGPQGRADG